MPACPTLTPLCAQSHLAVPSPTPLCLHASPLPPCARLPLQHTEDVVRDVVRFVGASEAHYVHRKLPPAMQACGRGGLPEPFNLCDK